MQLRKIEKALKKCLLIPICFFRFSYNLFGLEDDQIIHENVLYNTYRRSKNFQIAPSKPSVKNATLLNMVRCCKDWIIIFNKIYNIINDQYFNFESIDRKTSASFFHSIEKALKDNNTNLAICAIKRLDKYNHLNFNAEPFLEEWRFTQSYNTEDDSTSNDSAIEGVCKNVSALKALFDYNKKTSHDSKVSSDILSNNLIGTLAVIPEKEDFKIPIIKALLNSNLHILSFIDIEFYVSLYNGSTSDIRSLLFISILEPKDIFEKIQNYWKKESYSDLGKLYTGDFVAHVLSELSNNKEDIPYGNFAKLLKLVDHFSPETLSNILYPYNVDNNYFTLSRFIKYFYENDLYFFLERMKKYVNIDTLKKIIFLNDRNSIIGILHHSPALINVVLSFLESFDKNLMRSLYVYRPRCLFYELKPFFLNGLDNNVLLLILDNAESLFSRRFFIDKFCLGLCLAGNQNIDIILNKIRSINSKNLKTFIIKHKVELLKSTWRNVEHLYILLNKARKINDNFYTFNQLVKTHKKTIKYDKRFVKTRGVYLNSLVSILKKKDISALKDTFSNLFLNNNFKKYMLAFPNEKGENLLLITVQYGNAEAVSFIIDEIKRYDDLLQHLFLFYDNQDRNVFHWTREESIVKILEDALNEFGGHLLQELKNEKFREIPGSY